MKGIYTLLLLFLVFACSTQKQLQKSYSGKPLSYVKESFGEPKTVFDRGDEKVYIFEKVSKLQSTEVAQGKLALDPMITPAVVKTERYYFTVKDGVVLDARLEEEYEK